eukprot:Em0005g1231a
MATSSPEDTYSRFRLHLQGSFSSQEEKETFLRRFEAAKQLLAPGCKRNLNATISVLSTLRDRVLTQPENVQASNSRTSYSRNEMMLDSAGIYTGDEDASDQDLFVVERKTFKSLCSGLVQQCGCLSNPSWTIASFIKRGHVARVQFVCPHCKQSRVWASSRVLAGHYLANQKLVHAFTCAGMLPRQYMNFSLFAGMGVVKQKYISSVYLNQLYQQVVADVAEESMKAAVERVKESPHHATSGEQHRVAQTREVACTKIVLPQVIARGLNITEVAHDYQATIKLYVRQLGMVNSYDTWHGTKNVAKQLRRICAGHTRDRTWFTELSDKGTYFLDILIQQGAPRVITKVALLRVPVNSQVTFQKGSLSLCRQPLVHMRLHYEKPSSTKTLIRAICVGIPTGLSRLTINCSPTTAQKARPRSITLVLDSTLLALETSRLTLAILHYVLALFERAESNLNKVKRQVDSHTGRPRPSANARSF